MNVFLQELAETEVTAEETRLILQRLAVEEFGGSELSRVKDIAEPSGVDLPVVGRVLAEIRKTDDSAWKERVEAMIDHQSRQIDLLKQSEAKSDWNDRRLPDSRQLGMRLFHDHMNHKIQFRPITKKEWRAVGRILFFTVSGLVLLYLFLLASGAP